MHAPRTIVFEPDYAVIYYLATVIIAFAVAAFAVYMEQGPLTVYDEHYVYRLVPFRKNDADTWITMALLALVLSAFEPMWRARTMLRLWGVASTVVWLGRIPGVFNFSLVKVAEPSYLLDRLVEFGVYQRSLVRSANWWSISCNLCVLVAFEMVCLLVVYSGYKLWKHIQQRLHGIKVDVPDLERECLDLATQFAVDPQLLAVALNNSYAQVRDVDYMKNLNRQLCTWVREHRKSWTAVVMLNQVTTCILIASSHNTREQTSRVLLRQQSNQDGLRSIRRFTQGDLGGGAMLEAI
jgi:hypothetical protein